MGRVHASTREDLALLPEPVRSQILAVQVRAFLQARSAVMEHGRCWIILVDGVSAGFICHEAEADNAVRLVDIALLPEFRGKGIGGSVLGWLAGECDADGQILRLHVAPGNPAIHLYERLGFAVTENCGPHLGMEREPRKVFR